MDVCNPKLYIIGDRQYRRNPLQVGDDLGNGTYQEAENYKAQSFGVAEFDDGPCERIDEDIVNMDGIVQDPKTLMYSLRLPIASVYHKHIVGRGGETRKSLESRTKCKIDVPKMNQQGDIVISGSNPRHVAACRRGIEQLVTIARQRNDFTHFLSFPMNSNDIQSNFATFKALVLEQFGNCNGVEESIFQRPEKLHLTVLMLVLLTDSERRLASETLDRCYSEVIKPHLEQFEGPLELRMAGLNYMNDDPSSVDVLYSKVAPVSSSSNDRRTLQDMVDSIADYFVESGVVTKKSYDSVKLHVTLMNTRYRDSNDNGDNTKRQQQVRKSFDASGILREFSEFDFGVQVFTELHISIRHAFGDKGYYRAAKKIVLSD